MMKKTMKTILILIVLLVIGTSAFADVVTYSDSFPVPIAEKYGYRGQEQYGHGMRRISSYIKYVPGWDTTEFIFNMVLTTVLFFAILFLIKKIMKTEKDGNNTKIRKFLVIAKLIYAIFLGFMIIMFVSVVTKPYSGQTVYIMPEAYLKYKGYQDGPSVSKLINDILTPNSDFPYEATHIEYTEIGEETLFVNFANKNYTEIQKQLQPISDKVKKETDNQFYVDMEEKSPEGLVFKITQIK